MSNFYHNYIWKNGIPYGLGAGSEEAPADAYKIAMDPYRKRIAIEKWDLGKFVRVIYDSALLDFRHLQPSEQTAWQKVIVQEDSETVISEIRNQDDRTLLIETYSFEKGFCRHCHTHSAHRVPVAEQKLYYKALGDAFNGVILFDSAGRGVMFKRYSCDDLSGEFTDLIDEHWDMQKNALPGTIEGIANKD
ncbi:MAG: hypothetical protein H0U49_05545 [Parachlamydiaceae bacterium]|nr:hypothetical protein [Parachlamydiaceae bacterium]